MLRYGLMLPVECIVRGYITGSGWASYKENGTVCGIKLPEGLKESEHASSNIFILVEELWHVININRNHMISNNVLSIIKPEL